MIKIRPNCQNPKCTSGKPALIVLGGMFVCGECVLKFNANKNKMIQDIMNRDLVV